jgi:nucleoside 2-deoxyribosyltransferase
MKKIYLAGPDVFMPDASARFEAMQAHCAALGLHGVRPSDGGLSGLSLALAGTGDEIARRICAANIALIRDCDAVLANLMPFRNALEPDSGTVFEVGMAVALGKPVAGFLPDRHRRYEDKVIGACGVRRDAAGLAWDAAHGFMIEEFGQPMNLMLSCSTALFGSFEEALAHLSSILNGDTPASAPRC